nr:antitoxin Xre/MbcA/ParS toxin-binding domain-containing protein [uncultured Tolumonas sp.]
MNELQSKMIGNDQIWLGIVPGQRLSVDFLQMDADALRKMFIVSAVPVDVWDAAQQLFGNEHSSINWLCNPALGLGKIRPIDAIKTAKGKEAVMALITQLTYGIIS